jgi:hypothetical protein
MTEIDEPMTQRRVEQAEKTLAFAESLSILPAEPTTGLVPGSATVFEDVDPAFLDTVYAAQGGRKLLLTDDMIFRQLAHDVAGVDGVWTQVVALSAGFRGDLAREDYDHVVARLIGADYRFTHFDHEVALHLLAEAKWQMTHAVRCLADQLAAPTNEPRSVERGLTRLIRLGWTEAPNVVAYQQFFVVVFRAFRKAQPARDVGQLIRTAIGGVRARVRLNGYAAFLKRDLWYTTHSTPMQPFIDRIKQHADSQVEEVAAVLTDAAAEAARIPDGTATE